MLFRALDFFPVSPDLIDVFDFYIAKHMRMAANQLVGDVPGDVLEIERAAFLRQLTMENDLQQQIAKFLFQLVIVTGFDRVEQFIDFLHRVPPQRAMILLAIPRAAFGRTQLRHDIEQIVDGRFLFHTI